jgi:hypothetical protein
MYKGMSEGQHSKTEKPRFRMQIAKVVGTANLDSFIKLPIFAVLLITQQNIVHKNIVYEKFLICSMGRFQHREILVENTDKMPFCGQFCKSFHLGRKLWVM